MVICIVPIGLVVGDKIPRPRLTNPTRQQKRRRGFLIPTPQITHINIISSLLISNGKEGIIMMGAKIFAVWESIGLLHRGVRDASPSRSAFFCYLYLLFYNMRQYISRGFYKGFMKISFIIDFLVCSLPRILRRN